MVDNQNNNEEENDLLYIYEWIDSIELSKPKKNMARDFCDGLLVAEIIKNYLPRIVDIHNYPSTSSMKQKNYNWNTLNVKVLKKIGLQMSNNEINDVISCKPFAIEHLLQRIYLRIQKTTGINLAQKVKGKGSDSLQMNQFNSSEEDREKRKECMMRLEEKDISVQKIREIVNDLERKLENSNKSIRAQETKIEELTKLAKSRGLNV